MTVRRAFFISCNSRPRLTADVCSAEGFDHAFDVLEECKIGEEYLPVGGFVRPFYAPGGVYGAGWWSLDSALAVEGASWVDTEAGENLIVNLQSAQKPDGRIPFWYGDNPKDAVYNVHEKIGGLPKFYEVCYHAAVKSGNIGLCESAYGIISRNLGWWKTARLNGKYGLYTAVFEETFIPQTLTSSGKLATVDTNMEILTGMVCAAMLARRLEKKDAAAWNAEAKRLKGAIRRGLWDKRQRTFSSLWVTTGLHEPISTATAFMTLRYGVASASQKRQLLKQLDNPNIFGITGHALPSVAKNDPHYTVVRRPYIGNLSWSGSLWTLLDQAVIRALRDAEDEVRAAKLALATITDFADNYYEFLCPEDGKGYGVERYAWTASQFVQIVVEEIFGIGFDGFTEKSPSIPCRLPAA